MAFSLPEQERSFIQELDRILPGLYRNFEEALAVPEKERFSWAKEKQYHVYRDGWFRHASISIAHAETTGEHVDDLISIAKKYAPSHMVSDICAMLEVHDMTEAIAHTLLSTQGQILPRDINYYATYNGQKIEGFVKHHIESLAADIIFCKNDERKSLWFSFETAKTDTAKIANSLDKIHPLFISLDYIKMGYSRENLEIFWREFKKKIDAGKIEPLVVEIHNNILIPRKELLYSSLNYQSPNLGLM